MREQVCVSVKNAPLFCFFAFFFFFFFFFCAFAARVSERFDTPWMAAPYIICVCSGDGIGPEVCAQAERVLTAVGAKFGHAFTFDRALVGGAAWDATGEHLPAATLAACTRSDAVLFGSVGGPPTPAGQEPHPRWANAERNAILGAYTRPLRALEAVTELTPCCSSRLPCCFHRVPFSFLLQACAARCR